MALWSGWALLLAGPHAPLGVAVALLALWRLDRLRVNGAGQGDPGLGTACPQPPAALPPAVPAAAPLLLSCADGGRAALARSFGLREVDLFRAQHAPVCTVHHDERGRILLLECPVGPLETLLPDRDAHLVG